MSLTSQLPKTIGSTSILVSIEGYLRITHSRKSKLLEVSVVITTLIISINAITYTVYEKQSPFSINILPAWLLLVAALSSILRIKMTKGGAIYISPRREVLYNRTNPEIIDTIRQIETQKKQFATKVVIRGHKFEHDIAQFSKQEDADNLRNLIDEFINHPQDKQKSANESAS